jgi:hypothetical protein
MTQIDKLQATTSKGSRVLAFLECRERYQSGRKIGETWAVTLVIVPMSNGMPAERTAWKMAGDVSDGVNGAMAVRDASSKWASYCEDMNWSAV